VTIKTRSSFIYGFIIDAESTFLDFNEGTIDLVAELNPGSYTLTDLGEEISRAFNTAGTLEYTVTVDRINRKYTISTTATVSFLTGTGSNLGLDGWNVIGFNTGADNTGASSYESDNTVGSEFRPQFFLQDYVSFDNWKGFAASKVNESASGVTEVYSLGSRDFAEFNITLQNNGSSGNHPKNSIVEYDAQGETSLRSFMEFAITKGPMEFLPDRDDLSDSGFIKMLLESVPGSSSGTEFKLKELYGRGLTGWFETGKIKFRKLT
jgi:hypothetical protein